MRKELAKFATAQARLWEAQDANAAALFELGQAITAFRRKHRIELTKIAKDTRLAAATIGDIIYGRIKKPEFADLEMVVEYLEKAAKTHP